MIIGTGIDVVEIERIRSLLERSHQRFIPRVFTTEERRFCDEHRDPVPHYAVRFAAKEALFKAIGTGWSQGVTWKDVEVVREGNRPPVLRLHGEAGRRCRSLGTAKVHVTLSHSDQWAAALVILEGNSVTPPPL